MNQEAVKDLLYKMADDQLILGHRNSEWTGMGPLLEEDIAFSSMAQDKVGHAQQFYNILHTMGEQDPDTVAFMRNANQFHNCQLVELPNGEYDFSLIRHFLFDHAEYIRFTALANCPIKDIANLSKKLKSEVKYHVMHADTWIKQLGTSTEEAKARMQASLNEALPYALGIFEPSKHEQQLIADGIYPGEAALQVEWQAVVEKVIAKTELTLPAWDSLEPVYGGRYGTHTEHLQPLVEEMSEVFRLDPTAEW
ncbi:MAG TPA: phenylacetate-CoA oxygenase subunit PaaI [Cytophagales bacterium]|nr:phenylacetate-CoA oxygenase subunit PaaI [Cytophagales bacterium]